MEKTNAMRILDREKVKYRFYSYNEEEAISGQEVASLLNMNPKQLFKTLVTNGKSGQNYVFLVPVSEELDLKKASRAVGEKSISMVKSKDLFDLTGYIHGGCSPLAMKKDFPVIIDASSNDFERIIFNGGRRGLQIEVKLEDIKEILAYKIEDLI